MQKVIDQITDHLIGLVSTERPAYRPKDLLKAGYPTFAVERVRVVLEDILHREVSKPSTKWVDHASDEITKAWQQYYEKLLLHVSIPHNELYKITHRVISDIVNVFLQPRKALVDYLYLSDETLSFEELTERCSRLTIYKHFAKAIPLYMTKRSLEELTKERCSRLITNLDERLITNYTPENWADNLEMLFILFGGKVEAQLFGIFFEDKGLTEIAQKFVELDVLMTKSTFIEVLNQIGKDGLAAKKSDNPIDTMTVSSSDSSSEEKVVEESPDPLPSNPISTIEVEEEADLLNMFVDTPRESIEQETKNDIGSLNALFNDQEEEAHDKTESSSKTEPNENFASILDEARSSFNQVLGEDEFFDEDDVIQNDSVHEDEQDINVEEINEDKADSKDEEPITPLVSASEEEEDIIPEGEDKPMWAQFLSEDQMAVMMSKRESDEEPEITNAPSPKEETSPQVSLNVYLEPQSVEFIEALFSGSRKKYDKAVKKIESQRNWNSATSLLKKEVFDKNKIDMFSDEAVAFTDSLQTYFNKHK